MGASGRDARLDDYEEIDDYADSDEHEVEDSTAPLAIMGSFFLGVGCFVGIPSCLGIPFLL